jgi:hypothetical protein
VAGCEPRRVNTIRHGAWLACRSPPGLSRCRTVLPDDAGIGAAAHRCAQAASLRSRSGVISGGDEQQRRGVGADPVDGDQAGSAGGHQRGDELVQAAELAAGELRAAAQLARRDTGGIADHVAGAGPQRRQAADQRRGAVPGEPGTQVVGPGQDQGLAWLMVWVRSPAALRLATISARVASTWPSRPLGAPRARPDCAARAALTASSGSDLP